MSTSDYARWRPSSPTAVVSVRCQYFIRCTGIPVWSWTFLFEVIKNYNMSLSCSKALSLHSIFREAKTPKNVVMALNSIEGFFFPINIYFNLLRLCSRLNIITIEQHHLDTGGHFFIMFSIVFTSASQWPCPTSSILLRWYLHRLLDLARRFRNSLERIRPVISHHCMLISLVFQYYIFL